MMINIYSILISTAWVLILLGGLVWCIGNLIGARNEERRTRPVPEVDYTELQRAAEVAEMMSICKEVKA